MTPTPESSSSLNPQQQQAATFNGKHLLVRAGAGTGKTRVIIARARHLIDSGVPPQRILILSFTRKSAREIVERIKASFTRSQAEGLVGQTFHSWCMSLIKSNPNVFPFSQFSLLDEDDRNSCFKLICGKSFKTKEGKAVRPQLITEVYSYAINAQCSLSEAMRVKLYDNATDEETLRIIEKNKPVFAEIIKKYFSFKNERQYLDYDDLLNLVAKGLESNTEARDFISRRYDHILVDEMQDTNPLQYKLLHAFQDNCHLFCVGDDAQAIYGFRGADFKTIHNFTHIVPQSEECQLTLNYRSTQQILDLSNWLLDCSQLKYDKFLVAARGDGNTPMMIHWDNEWEEANDITDRILNSVTDNGYRWSDNMVLSRSMWGLRKVEVACIEKQIPYKVYGGTGLMQSKHVRDVAAPMRIIANYHDEIAWMRYLQLWRGVGEITASRAISEVINEPSLDACLQKLASLNLQKEISATLVSISHMQFMPSVAIETALKTMEKRLQELYKDEWEWRSRDFDVLKEVAMESTGISEFVSEYILDPKLETTVKAGAEDNECVVLTTIHSAKGLEAANCYITNASTFSYPSVRAMQNGFDAVEEERRCLYVALTRAKDNLLIYRDIHSIHTINNSPESSQYFFNNLPPNLVQTVVINDNTNDNNTWTNYNGSPINNSIGSDFDFN